MTEVAFHVNVPDTLAYTCRLLRKAQQRGWSALVLCGPRELEALDRQLWAMRPEDFVPHCRATHGSELVARTPVVLSADRGHHLPERAFDALVNLTPTLPEGVQRFGRVFEVVSLAEADLQAARSRWRAYKDAGLEPKRHEIPAA